MTAILIAILAMLTVGAAGLALVPSAMGGGRAEKRRKQFQGDIRVNRLEADAARNAIFAEAFGRDPEFFAFTRSMTAYERALQAGNSQIVVKPEGDFFTYLSNDGAANAKPATPPEALPPLENLSTLPAQDGASMDPIQADSASLPPG